QCGFCQQMAPRLSQLPESRRILLVSRRAPEETRASAEQFDLHCDVVVEPGWDVASSYGTNGTPTGYLIDAHGRIASTLAVGADALLALTGCSRPLAGGSSSSRFGSPTIRRRCSTRRRSPTTSSSRTGPS